MSRLESNGEQLVQGGLYEGFEAYRTPTNDDYRDVLTDGLVVPDTNVFLNLYRYNQQTRNDLFAVLRGLGARLWVPSQVMTEFWRNRENVLQDPRDIEKTAKELAAKRDEAVNILRRWADRVGLSSERGTDLREILLQAFGNVIDEIGKLAEDNAEEFIRNTNKDPVLIELEGILCGRVGGALDETEYEQALAEAERRAEAKQPPGYMDFGKPGTTKAGDYLVWLQIMKEAQCRQQNVLVVTGDVKEDWWRRDHGELRGPQPELVEEMRKSQG